MDTDYLLHRLRDPVVDRFFGVLLPRGFGVDRIEYSPRFFGNLLIEVYRDTVYFRSVLDRSQWSIEVMTAPASEWVHLCRLHILATGMECSPGWPVEEQLVFLEQHLEEIISVVRNNSAS